MKDQTIANALKSTSEEERDKIIAVLDALEGLSVFDAEHVLRFCGDIIRSAGVVTSLYWRAERESV